MGELIRAIYDVTCVDLPNYLRSNIPLFTSRPGQAGAGQNIYDRLKKQHTLAKVEAVQNSEGEIEAKTNTEFAITISSDDLEYGYSNAKPGMPFFRKGYGPSYGYQPGLSADFGLPQVGNKCWEQSVLYSGNLGKGFYYGFGGPIQDDMLYESALPPPNRSLNVKIAESSGNPGPTGNETAYLSDNWATVVTDDNNKVGIDAADDGNDLVMDFFSGQVAPGTPPRPRDPPESKETATGNNLLGYPYRLNYLVPNTNYPKPTNGKCKYRWAYYFTKPVENELPQTATGGIFL